AKSDALDAARAARAVLAQARPAAPRAGGSREALRALMVAREGALTARKAALCQLRSLLVTGPEELRARLEHLSRARLLRACAALRPGQRSDVAAAGLARALRSLARRIRALDGEEHALKREIELLVAQLAPALLAEPGIGPISAAQLLLSWSHRGRIRSEAAFARLAAAAPIPASSGKTVRHRLDPGGDRKLNRALHTIIVARRKHHPPTIAYCARRTREGKNARETIRCLKRYLARHLYRLLETMPATA
ncbi:MAG: transposase, partial [Gaiellaceae bacterium]